VQGSQHGSGLCAASGGARRGRGTVILGFEQMNKYSILDQDGTTVALMAEDAGGLGSAVGRQVLKRRRAFTATVFSPDGAPLPSLSGHVLDEQRRLQSRLLWLAEAGVDVLVGEARVRSCWRAPKRAWASVRRGGCAWRRSA